MKLTLTILFLFSQISIYSFDHPIKVLFSKQKKDSYTIQVLAPKGFAVQKDAPNKIKLTGSKLDISQKEVSLKGKLFLDKPDYFETVDSVPLQIKGKGKLEIVAKIYYCDLNKNVCYPATIKQEEIIQ